MLWAALMLIQGETLPAPRRYSLELRDVPLEPACRMIAEATGATFLPEATEGTVTVSVREATFFELLDAVNAGLESGRFEVDPVSGLVYLDRVPTEVDARSDAGPIRFERLGEIVRARWEPGLTALAFGDWRVEGEAVAPVGWEEAPVPSRASGDVAVTVARAIERLREDPRIRVHAGGIEVDLPEDQRESWRVWMVTDCGERVLYHAVRDPDARTETVTGVTIRLAPADAYEVHVVTDAAVVRVPFRFTPE